MEELRFVKKKLKCSLCDVRDKNVVITRCYHTFCRECIESNLASRNRACPGCNKLFNPSEVQTIYLS